MPETSSPNDVIATARALRPRISEHRSESETLRHLPDPIVIALKDSGICRIALPSSVVGLELNPVLALQVYEELAKAEASVAWIAWNNALPCLFSRLLSDETRADIFSDQSRMFTSSTRPTGKAIVDGDAYRVSGRWTLVSGCMHADWIALMCLVEDQGEIQMGAPGVPLMRFTYLPRGTYEIVDTWNAGGLRGTGSHDVVAEDIAVPAKHAVDPFGDPSRIDTPFGRLPIVSTMAAGHASICLGIVSAALDAVTELGRTKTSVDPVPDLRDRPSNQHTVATAATKLEALRGHVRRTLGSMWGKVETGAEVTPQDIADVWSAACLTQQECKSIVAALYETAGTTAVYTDFPVERSLRDIHAATQHVIAQSFWLEEAGRVAFGLTPNNPLFLL